MTLAISRLKVLFMKRMSGCLSLSFHRWLESIGRCNTSTKRSCDGSVEEAAVRSSTETSDAIAGSPEGEPSREPAAFLGDDRPRAIERRGGARHWAISARSTMKRQSGWAGLHNHGVHRNGAAPGIDVCSIGQAADTRTPMNE
jgi:hypothetical protein